MFFLLPYTTQIRSVFVTMQPRVDIFVHLESSSHAKIPFQRSRRVMADQREDLERLAQYIIRNPFSVEKMQVNPANRCNPDGSIIYRSAMNPKIQRNFD